MDTYHKQAINQRSAALLSKQLVQTEPCTVYSDDRVELN